MNYSKTGTFLLYLAALSIFAFGILYIYVGFTSGLMPYHVKFLGKTCNELPLNVCELMKTFVQIIGFAFTAIGISGLFITRNFAKGIIGPVGLKVMAIALLPLVPIIPVMIHIGPFTPWYLVTGILVVAFTGLLLARPKKD